MKRAVPYLRWLFACPCIIPSQITWVFSGRNGTRTGSSEYFGFHRKFSYNRQFYTYQILEAGTIEPLGACIPSGLSLTLLHALNKPKRISSYIERHIFISFFEYQSRSNSFSLQNNTLSSNHTGIVSQFPLQ